MINKESTLSGQEKLVTARAIEPWPSTLPRLTTLHEMGRQSIANLTTGQEESISVSGYLLAVLAKALIFIID